jgi:hypothetical protein
MTEHVVPSAPRRRSGRIRRLILVQDETGCPVRLSRHSARNDGQLRVMPPSGLGRRNPGPLARNDPGVLARSDPATWSARQK